MAKQVHLMLDRHEVMYLWERVSGAMKVAQNIINNLTGPVNVHTDEQAAQLKAAREMEEALKQPVGEMMGILAAGDKQRLNIQDIRKELTEALDLVEEDEAKAAIHETLGKLPKDEPYRITMERDAGKHTLEMVERDILNYQTKVIPHHEKMDKSAFADKMFTKSYYVNLKKKEKTILEGLRSKIMKELG